MQLIEKTKEQSHDFVQRETQLADVVVFTEWRRKEASGAETTWAASRGMKWMGACDGATKNGVFVASALPFQSVSVTPGLETAGTLLRVAFDRWTMLAAYFPQREAKARYFRAWSDVATSDSAAPFLLVGDLNTGNQLADRTPNGDKYVCAELFDGLSGSPGLVDLGNERLPSRRQPLRGRHGLIVHLVEETFDRGDPGLGLFRIGARQQGLAIRNIGAFGGRHGPKHRLDARIDTGIGGDFCDHVQCFSRAFLRKATRQ